MVRKWLPRRRIMVLPLATGAIILTTLTRARPTDTTGRLGLTAASSSAQVPGTDGAGVADGAVTVIAVDMDTAAATAIAAGTQAVADTQAAIAAVLPLEAMQVAEPAVDTQVAELAAAMQVAAEPVDLVVAAADSTAVAVDPTAVAVTGKA